MHDNQLDISPDVVRTLVERQFPQWRSLPVRHVAATGTVNAIFRIGDLYAARFPLKAGDVDVVRRSLEAEAKAAAELAGRTRFQTPEPVALGEPGAGYPLPWSVQTWLAGTVATDADPGDSAPFAVDLAEFIVGVRSIPALGRTFSGPGRGGDLHDHDEWLETCFVRSAGLLDVNRLRRMWAELRDLPRGDAADVMNHGDLMPGNVLVWGDCRRLAGVLDVGGLEAADPALDLVSAWHLLETGPREALREALGSDDLEWGRGKAWAFQQSMGLVWYYADSNPAMAGVGRRTLDRLIADERPLPAPLAESGVDYLAFSRHKLYAPYGAGALVGRRDWLEASRPYLAGGGAVREVRLDRTEWAGAPAQHEAGTPNVIGAVALAAACQTVAALGPEAVRAHEGALIRRLSDGLAAIDGVRTLRLWPAPTGSRPRRTGSAC